MRLSGSETHAPRLAEVRFDLVLTGYPATGKIALIKAIRACTGCSLREVAHLVGAEPPHRPVIRSGLTRGQCRQARALFRGVAEVAVRDSLRVVPRLGPADQPAPPLPGEVGWSPAGGWSPLGTGATSP
jgi:hypothetical protein